MYIRFSLAVRQAELAGFVAVGVAVADCWEDAAKADLAEGEPPQADKLSPSVAIRASADKDRLYFIVGDPQVMHGARDACDARVS